MVSVSGPPGLVLCSGLNPRRKFKYTQYTTGIASGAAVGRWRLVAEKGQVKSTHQRRKNKYLNFFKREK